MRKKNGGTKNRTAVGVAALLAAALLLGGCSTAFVPTPAPTEAPTQAPTSVPTQAPTPKPTATPEPLSQEEQIVASVREDLRMLATEDREIALVAQEDAIYTFTLNGRYVGPNIMFVDGGFIFASGTDITDEMSFTYGVGFVCLLRAVLPEREMSFSDGYDAYQEWFLLPYSQTSSVVEKQIDGHDFAYGLHKDYGWMLIVSF